MGGSHAWGRKFIPRKFEDKRHYGTNKESLEYDFPGQPNFRIEEEVRNRLHSEFENLEFDKSWEVIQWACAPGDIVAFHGWTLHGGSPSPSSPRRVVSLRWFGDDCVFTQRPWICSPPYLADLKDGDPIFPTIYPREKQ